MEFQGQIRAGSAGEAPPMLVSAVLHLLRPLVRLLVANQVTYPLLTRMLKRVYVDVAERDFAIDGKPQTASRLSLLTGIHRKEIQRLRDHTEDDAPPGSDSLGARLVARWTGSREYLGGTGDPLPLPRTAPPGEPSFEALVASVSKDIRPRSVIDEWQRLGVVEIDDRDRLRLVGAARVPALGLEEKAHYFGRSVHDHIAAAGHNLAGGDPPLMERSTYYDGLSAESVFELAHLAERHGMAALQVVNARAQELQALDAAETRGAERMSFGVYFLRAPDDDDA
jgi:hypothetical protein